MTEIEAYIRTAAIARGIDPDVAVAVAKSEGGLTNPVRQSDVVKNGRREPSYGPFQLYFGGGLGDQALKAGIDARDPNQWKQGVDFALNTAAKSGWGDWYGAKNTGIGNWEGIKGARPVGISLNSTPAAGGTAPTPNAVSGAPAGLPTFLAELLGEDGGKSLAGAVGGGGERRAASADIAPSGIGAEIGGGSGAYQAAAQLMASLLDKKRKLGVSLGGTYGL